MKRTPIKARSPKKRKQGHCDTLYSQIVRSRGFCELCGRTDAQLHCHHLIARSATFFRHNLENGICLCSRCHIFNNGSHASGEPPSISAHGTPIAFNDWLRDNNPDKHAWYEKNRWNVIKGERIDYDRVYEMLKEQANG